MPKHPQLLFLAQNLGVLRPSISWGHFFWDTLYMHRCIYISIDVFIKMILKWKRNFYVEHFSVKSCTWAWKYKHTFFFALIYFIAFSFFAEFATKMYQGMAALGTKIYQGLTALVTKSWTRAGSPRTISVPGAGCPWYKKVPGAGCPWYKKVPGAGSPKYKKVIEGWQPLVQKNN